jgi:hypothetical protein
VPKLTDGLYRTPCPRTPGRRVGESSRRSVTTKERSRPPGGNREGGLKVQSLGKGTDAFTVANGASAVARPPKANAIELAPCAKRRLFSISYVCPHCGGCHLARSIEPVRSEVRRSGCGRLVTVVVKRRYGTPDEAER